MYHPLTNYKFRSIIFCMLLFVTALLGVASLRACDDVTPGVYAATVTTVTTVATAAPAQRNDLDFDVNITPKGDLTIRVKDSERERILLTYAKSKGYQENVWLPNAPDSTLNQFVANPQTPGEYLADYLEREISEVLLRTDIEVAKANVEETIRNGAKTKLPKTATSLIIKQQ